ncbi:hypothetical protein KM295_14180 [Natronomonas sp. F2-12]|uniref:Uncharacterized protein n=1 Tax=Natronomonas aquatica TaxID=2841590 RepID=A0A9R1D7C9_9EURY|nr:hypothetical protein [Natronomonas aquatica]MCQ4334603.1 hypothetical protein [Natronomonas aquatica]
MSDAAETNGHGGTETPPESDDTAERHETNRLGRAGAWLLTTIPKPIIGFRETLFKRMAVKSLENYYKASGGDALGINAQPGQRIEFEPIKYRTPEETDEGEKPGWKVKGRDKVWHPGRDGNSVDYLGRAPAVLLDDDDHAQAGWLKPRIGEAIDLDNYFPVFTNPTFRCTLEYGDDTAADVTNGAIPDGGYADKPIDFELDGVEEAGEWLGDTVIDIDSGDGYDGMRISARKAAQWRAEETDSEHMQMQEDRGYIRGLANGDEGPGIIKLLLICAGIILGTLAIVLLGPKLLGSGGGGGSLPSLMVNTLGTVGAI